MNRASIPHTKTFTGCWTCRGRHVKCDEKRPECGPCQKRKVPCEGYGVRLVWNPDEKGISRPSLKELRHEPTTVLSARQLAVAIADLDEIICGDHDSYQNGPFSVFNIDDRGNQCDSQPTIVSTPTNDLPGSSSDPHLILSPEHSGDTTFYTIPAPDLNGPSPASTECIPVPPPETDTLQHTTPRPLLPWRPPPFLNPNPLPPRDTVLVHHWVTFVCANSVLGDGATNFSRTIYTPLAVQHPGRSASAPASRRLPRTLRRGRLQPRARLPVVRIVVVRSRNRHRHAPRDRRRAPPPAQPGSRRDDHDDDDAEGGRARGYHPAHPRRHHPRDDGRRVARAHARRAGRG